MAFSNGQDVFADDLNNLSITTVTTTGAGTIGGALTVTGGQIVFPAAQAASAGANTLDDYEEGTWTPVIGGAVSESGQTYGLQAGSYVKVGQLVLAQFDIVLTAKGTITGNVQIKGLPFAAALTAGNLQVGYWENFTTAIINISGFVNAATTVAPVYIASGATTSMGALGGADLSNTSRIAGTAVYRAAA
jgi:hypothetical protein